MTSTDIEQLTLTGNVEPFNQESDISLYEKREPNDLHSDEQLTEPETRGAILTEDMIAVRINAAKYPEKVNYKIDVTDLRERLRIRRINENIRHLSYPD